MNEFLKERVKKIIEKNAPEIPSEREERQEKLDRKKEECYYKCGVPLGNEYFIVIKGDKLVRAHKRCHAQFERSGEVNIRMIIK